MPPFKHDHLAGALILALMAGCGANSNDPAVPASDAVRIAPQQLRTGKAPDATAPATSTATSGAAANDEEAAEAAEASSPAATATAAAARQATHLRDRSISTELLAAMLLHGGSSNAAPMLPGGRTVDLAPRAPQVDAAQRVEAGGPASHQVQVDTGMWKGLSGNGGGELLDFLSFYGGASNEGKFTRVALKLPVDLEALARTSATDAQGTPDLSPAARLARGTPMLKLNQAIQATVTPVVMPAFTFNTGARWIEPQTPQTLTLETVNQRILPTGRQLRFGRSIQRWQDAQGNRVRLFAQRGARRDEVRLCLESRLPQSRRLACSQWQVPAGWTPGQALTYRGHHVADDRAQVGLTGVQHWQTLPPAPARHMPVLGSGPASPAAPISEQGVSGDVLATMLSQPTAQVRGLPWSGQGPDAQALPEARTRPVYVTQAPRFAAPFDTPAFARSLWLEQGSALDYQAFTLPMLTFRSLSVSMHLQANLGTFTPAGADGEGGSFSLAGTQAAGSGTPILSLSHSAYASIGYLAQSDRDRRYYPSRLALAPQGRKQLHKGVAVGFDQPVQQWRSIDGTTLQLSVQRGRGADEAWMCLHVQTPNVIDRRTCSIWQVPASWQLGQPLIYRGAHVSDNREIIRQPGETALYWQGTPG
ncbi:MAG: hypothetical protein Q4E06_10505 [Lautropia sp.]|nr:hypothetical protein [Lautropia sp.]